MSEKTYKEIRVRNNHKPSNNLWKISRWLHITILLFLDEKDIVTYGGVWKSLYDSANDEFIWKHRFISLRGIYDFKSVYNKHITTSKEQSERSQKGQQYKIKCLRQMNAGKNMMTARFQPLNIKLTGHTDSVITVSGLGDYLASGGKDKWVKLWNLKDNSCITYRKIIIYLKV